MQPLLKAFGPPTESVGRVQKRAQNLRETVTRSWRLRFRDRFVDPDIAACVDGSETSLETEPAVHEPVLGRNHSQRSDVAETSPG